MSDGSQPADLPLPENAGMRPVVDSATDVLMRRTGMRFELALSHSMIVLEDAASALRAQGAAAERKRIQPELDRIEHDAIARYEEFAATQRLAIAGAERDRIRQLVTPQLLQMLVDQHAVSPDWAAAVADLLAEDAP